jgi:hypothetical protein
MEDARFALRTRLSAEGWTAVFNPDRGTRVQGFP